MSRTRTIGILASAALGLGLVMPVAPASANTYDYHLSASVDGAQGGAWVDFEQGRYGGHFRASVMDNKCDGNDVYISFYTDGGLWQQFRNSRGCRQTIDWGWRSFTYRKNQPASTVRYVYVRVCVDDFGSDTCATSARRYNPYH